MILLWGVPGDGPMAQVRDALVRMGQPRHSSISERLRDPALRFARALISLRP